MPGTAAAGQQPQAGIRVLGVADLAQVARLVAGRRFTPEILAAEFGDPGRYRWLGAFRPDGHLAAAHRALRWGGYQFLKGVFVDAGDRGGDAALRLAFALREEARSRQMSGIAAWVSEGSRAQLALARRLRLEPAGEPLHLYALRFEQFTRSGQAGRRRPARARAAGRIEETLARLHAERPGRCLVPGLFLPPGPDGHATVSATGRAMADRDRLLLSSLPCADPEELTAMLTELAPAAHALALPEAEIPVPAAAIPLALWLSARKAQRISQRPVYVGRSYFTAARESQS